MTLLVLDASAAMEAVLQRPNGGKVLDLVEEAHRVSAPELFAVEVAIALWKHTKVGDLDNDVAQIALENALEMVDYLEPSLGLVPEALATASAHNHSVYDALYAVLARRTGSSVCTFDRRLTKLLDVMVVPYILPNE